MAGESVMDNARSRPAPVPPVDAHRTITSSRPQEGCALVTIDRPAQRNAMALSMWHRLADLVDELGQDDALRSIIVTGAGGAFSAGADIKEFDAVRSTPQDTRAYAAAVDRVMVGLSRCPKATFAAVSGPAFGGGCGIALACDFRIAGPDARFAIPAARRGLVYGIEESRLVYLTVGLVTAKALLFSGRAYDAAEALAAGIADEVTQGDPLQRALERADALSASAPLSIAGNKLVLNALAMREVEAKADEIEAMIDKAMASEDYHEATRSFVEKRPPRFTGR